jgi:uncharacterized protein (DUF58 family)
VIGWRPTAALSRALLVGALAVVVAILAGEPSVMVLGAPLVLCATFSLLGRPTSWPTLSTRLDHRSLHEGQGTTSRLHIDSDEDVEQVTRVAAGAAYVAMHPWHGLASRLYEDGAPEVEISPRRWGRRLLGAELVALTSPWAGYRWGPVELTGNQLRVLPQNAPFDSRAQAPRPVGLVGAHRSRRLGAGTEFADIRPFRLGDRLRRISWRVSVRTQELHVTTSPAEQDSGVLLVVDALGDHGTSGGVEGEASSLDLSVRAAAALAEHHIREGDRVALRVVSFDGNMVRYGAGARHLRVIQDTLAGLRAGELPEAVADRLQLPATGGTVVFVLSPMLSTAIGTATATLALRGLPVVVIDTLPASAGPHVPAGVNPALAGLAWRMRRLERERVLSGLAAIGAPVIPWRGPGTVDDVVRRLARRSASPQAGAR